jgi:hypothetical protein
MSVKINTPDVLHESFGDESVIVNLRQGVYYSLSREGLFLWEEIAKETTLDRLFGLAAIHSVNGVLLAPASVARFLRQLHEEHLIVIEGEMWPVSSEEMDADAKMLPPLQKFEDLHDLLTLDPIHEVDERGWPHARSEVVNPS